MKNLFSVIIGAVIALVGFSANATVSSNMFDTKEQCEAAAATGTGLAYVPTERHSLYGQPARKEGLTKGPAERSFCKQLQTARGWKWVIIREGTMVWAKDGIPVLLADCENPFRGDHVVVTYNPPIVQQSKVAEAVQQLPGTTSVTPVQLAVLGQSPVSVPGLPREGVVYSDGNGNTFQSEQLGSRQCNYVLNGKVVETIFAPNGLDDVQSKKYCDVYGEAFKARHRPTTPSSRLQASPAAYNTDVSFDLSDKAPALAPAAPTVATPSEPNGNGNVTCNFRQDGKIVKTEKFNTDAECKAWTQKEAKERGLIPA